MDWRRASTEAIYRRGSARGIATPYLAVKSVGRISKQASPVPSVISLRPSGDITSRQPPRIDMLLW